MNPAEARHESLLWTPIQQAHPQPTVRYAGETMKVHATTYLDGCLAVIVYCEDGSPYATASIHLSESEHLPTTEPLFYLKAYSENEGIAQALIDQGVIERANPFPLYPEVQVGFVSSAVYRVR